MSMPRIIVAAHKPYSMPADPVYLPLQVGASGHEPISGFARDDEGDNISSRNARWCELTGLYWAWKNLEADAVGLVHYRRHFKGVSGIATGAELSALLDRHDAILPKPRNYFIESTYSQYAHAHHAQDLDVTRTILARNHPECLASFDAVMKSTRGHRFNMFVMKRALFDAYCAWLFDVLFELERQLDISAYSSYDARVFGFVGERLLDVWLDGTPEGRSARIVEMPVLHLESQCWPKKVVRFLCRKFFSKSGLRDMARNVMMHFDWRVVLGLLVVAVILGALNNLRVFEEQRVEWFGGPVSGGMEE